MKTTPAVLRTPDGAHGLEDLQLRELGPAVMHYRPIRGRRRRRAEALRRQHPDGDHTSLDARLLDPDHVATTNPAVRGPLAGDDHDHVAAARTVVPAVGWSSHVGQLRLFVHADHRRHGAGTELARRGLLA